MTTMDVQQRSEASHELGLKYTRAQHQEVLVAKDEEVRRQRVQVSLLADENSQLKSRATQLDSRVAKLEAQYEDAMGDAEDLQIQVNEQTNQLRAQEREHDTLRNKLMAYDRANTDSAELLTEKLALSRELAMLKPEVDHLRSQLNHQKDVLSEKLALEQQLNTLEVELANEKRAAQRTAQRQTSSDNDAEEALKQQVQDLEKKLAAEKRAREKTQRELEARGSENESTGKYETAASKKLQGRVKELEKALEDEKRESQRTKKLLETEVSEARGEIDVFEQRVDDLKSKLREVREELKGVRAELSAATASAVADKPGRGGVSVPTKEGAPVKKTKTVAKKRRAEEPSGPELMLQTPGMGNEGRAKRPLKKRGFDPSMAVQKSTFSITPFLNKTTNPMDESDAAPAASTATAAAAAAANVSRQAANDEASSLVSAAEDATAPEDESELPEDSIMGRRISASGATLESVDISESSTPSIVAKAANAANAVGGEQPKRRGRPAKEKASGDAPVSKKSTKAQTADKSASMSAPDADAPPIKKATAIDEASSEQENDVAPVAAAPKPALKEKKSAAAAAKAVSEAEPKKKKRKILGAGSKTVFDEDDDNGDDADMVAARPMKAVAAASAAAGGVKRLAKPLGGAGRAAGGPVNKRTMLGGTRNAFGGAAGGGFSPLKRQRRGVNASFLA